MDTTTTLGRRCASDLLPVALLEYLSEQAEMARRTLSNGGGVHLESVESFRNWLASHNDLDDPRLWALWTLQGASGDTNGFTPSDLQANLIARLGTSGPVPDPSSTLSELVAAGIEDAITSERAEQRPRLRKAR